MKLLNVLLFLVLCYCCKAQKLHSFMQDSLYGFADASGKVIIASKYENVTEFGSPYFVQPEQGEDRVSSDATEIRPQLRLAHVKENGEWTVINTNGDSLLTPRSTKPFGIKTLGLEPLSIYSKNCNQSIDSIEVVSVINFTNELWSLFNLRTEKSGAQVYIHIPPHQYRVKRPKQTFQIVRLELEKTKQHKMLDWAYLEPFHFGTLPPVQQLMDIETGELVIPREHYIHRLGKHTYFYADSVGQGYLFDGKSRMSTTLPHPTTKVYLNSNGKNEAVDVGPWGCTITTRWDPEGYDNDRLIRPHFASTRYPDSINRISYYEIGQQYKVGLTDENHRLILDTIYERILIVNTHLAAYTFKKENNTRVQEAHLFEMSGEPLKIPSCQFAREINHDLFIVMLKTKKMSLVDRSGNFLSKEYDKIDTYGDKFKFRLGDLLGILDEKGVEEVSYPCDNIEQTYSLPIPNYGKLYRFYKDTSINGSKERLTGLISQSRAVLLPARYKSILIRDKKPIPYVQVKSIESKIGFMNLDGSILIPILYDRILEIFDREEKVQFVCLIKGEEVARYDASFMKVK